MRDNLGSVDCTVTFMLFHFLLEPQAAQWLLISPAPELRTTHETTFCLFPLHHHGKWQTIDYQIFFTKHRKSLINVIILCSILFLYCLGKKGNISNFSESWKSKLLILTSLKRQLKTSSKTQQDFNALHITVQVFWLSIYLPLKRKLYI